MENTPGTLAWPPHLVRHGVASHTDVVKFTIRNATLADMLELQGVFRRASLSNDSDRESLLAHPKWLLLSETGVQEGRVRLAIDLSSSVIGFASYLISSGIAELEDLFVDPSWMRRGVGEALVLDIAEQVHRLGFDVLEVTANPHAMAFYEHMGFVVDRIVDTEFYPAPRMLRQIG